MFTGPMIRRPVRKLSATGLHVYSRVVLKIAMPRPSTDAVLRSVGSDRPIPVRPFADDRDEPLPRRWTRAEADALARQEPSLSPWKVVASQVAVGVVAAVLAAALFGVDAAWSALYGAAIVAVPGALMARAATSRLAALSPVASTASLLGWGFMKIVVSIVMLGMASRVVPGLVWPAMLATLFMCLQTYWFALLVRGRPQ